MKEYLTTQTFGIIFSDAFLLLVMCAAMFFSKFARPAVIAFVAFSLTLIYSSNVFGEFAIWDKQSDVVNHVIYAFPFIMAVFFVEKVWVKFSLMLYALLQLAASLDALLYGNAGIIEESSTWLYDNYLYLQILFALVIVLSLFGGGRERRAKHSTHTDTAIHDLSRHSPYYRHGQKG